MILILVTIFFTQPGVNVAQDPGGLYVDGMDVGHRLHLDAVLQQQLFDLLRLGQDRHCRRKRGQDHRPAPR